METLWTLVLLVLLIVLGALWWLSRDDKVMHNIPGPKPMLFFGNIFQMGDGGTPYLKLDEWAKQYGPILKLKNVSAHVLVVSDFDSIYEVLVKKSKAFAGRQLSYRSYVGNCGAYGIIDSDPDAKWRSVRKVVHGSLKAFGPGMGRIEDLALQMTDQFLTAFQKTNGKPIDPLEEIYNASLRMITLITLGEVYDTDSEEHKTVAHREKITHRIGDFTPATQLIDVFPWLRFFPNKLWEQLLKARDACNAMWDDSVRPSVSKFDFENNQFTVLPVVHAMVQFNTKNTVEELAMSQHYMKASFFQITTAGIGTTTNSLHAFLNIMLHYPEVQDSIHKEIDQVLGEKTIGLNYKADLPYTWACVYELLRYTSIVPVGVPHKVLQDVDLFGHTIPKDTILITNLWSLHHDDKFWEAPFKFRPERFLDGDGKLVSPDHPTRKHLMPFSAGTRVCVGETMAIARLFLWIVSILQRFQLKPEGDAPTVSCDSRTYIPDIVLRHPPYKVRFIQRHMMQ